ncbi:hypothetical protein TNCV_3770541 [Trichonephila clavipes]|nr:hypothetical protein TNCV_3770541 [Trichonephila clavipes]
MSRASKAFQWTSTAVRKIGGGQPRKAIASDDLRSQGMIVQQANHNQQQNLHFNLHVKEIPPQDHSKSTQSCQEVSNEQINIIKNMLITRMMDNQANME